MVMVPETFQPKAGVTCEKVNVCNIDHDAMRVRYGSAVSV
jgi:hypothetical protein